MRATPPSLPNGRLARIRAVIDDVIARRSRGESVLDVDVTSSHVDLMPELGEELRRLAVVQRGYRAALEPKTGAGLRPRTVAAENPSSGHERLATDAPVPQITGYDVLEEVHRGGQGVVYRAIQLSTGQSVAIKLMRDRPFAGEADRIRFEREVAILARLKHPNIVAIHDKGVAAGATFFVMDYIEGALLDEWVSGLKSQISDSSFQTSDPRPASRLAGKRKSEVSKSEIPVALRLFAKVCDAVQAAHLHGVIHRDLKPSNIRVDAQGEPHVLDFGLAKEIDAAGATMTAEGQFVGSLPWAAPEQVNGSNVDARTDVYSLGVVLFQILTGSFPYSVRGPMADVIRAITSAEPARPGSVRREIDHELDTLVLKCLCKERSRRYQSAGDLASDVRCYLAGEPIEAKRDSALYLLRKTARRYRWALAAGTAFVVLLAAFAAYAAFQARKFQRVAQLERDARQAAEFAEQSATLARIEADRERDQAARARDAEAAQRGKAERETDHARAVTAFLVDMLGLADPDITQTPDMTVQQFLERASAEITDAFASQPEDEATVRRVIGQAYAALGEPEAARTHLDRAFELRSKIASTSSQERYEVLWPLTRVMADASDTLASARLTECQTLGQRVLAESCPELASSLKKLAGEMKYDYEAEEGEALHREVAQLAHELLAPGDERWLLVGDQFYLCGQFLGSRQNPGPACDYLRRAVEIYRSSLPETNTRIVRALGLLITCALGAEQYIEGEALTRESLALLSKTLPENHWYVELFRARLGGCLVGQGRFEEAEPLLLDGYDAVVKHRGDAGRHAAEIVHSLIRLYEATGEDELAEQQRSALAVALAGSPEDATWRPTPGLSNSARMVFGPRLAPLAEALDRLEQSGSTGLSAEAVAELIALRRSLLPDEHAISAVVADLFQSWAEKRARRGDRSGAPLVVLEEAERIGRASDVLYGRKRADTLAWLGLVHGRAKAYDQAERCYREALAILDSGFGTYAYSNYVQALLGDNLVRQGKFAEAEPVLQAGYRGLRDYSGPATTNLAIALNGLLLLYDRWDRIEQFAPFGEENLRDLLAEQTTSASTLRDASWRIVKHAGIPARAYPLALQAAERAFQLKPEPEYRPALAAAHYRTGHYAAALQTLTEVDPPKRGAAVHAALLAMTHHHLGQTQLAEDALRRLQAFLTDRLEVPSEDDLALLAEAQQVVVHQAAASAP